jgi:hypothetical protein
MEGGESSGHKSQLIRNQERSHNLEDEETSGKVLKMGLDLTQLKS